MKPAIIRKSWGLFAKCMPRLSCEIDFLRRNKYFEKDLWLIQQFCDKKHRAIDVGANAGIFSRWMAKHAQHVDSFECNPNLLPRLKGFVPKNVTVHQCALSNKEGQATLRFDPGNTGVGTIESRNKLDQNPGIQSIQEVNVPVRQLDNFNLSRVSFMKVDVEGHELEVLQGAVALLRRERPVLLIEIEERHCQGNVESVPQWLAELGYRPKVLDPHAMKLTTINSVRQQADGGTNNFWFIAE